MSDSMRSIMISKARLARKRTHATGPWVGGKPSKRSRVVFCETDGHPALEFEALCCIDGLDVVFIQHLIRGRGFCKTNWKILIEHAYDCWRDRPRSAFVHLSE